MNVAQKLFSLSALSFSLSLHADCEKSASNILRSQFKSLQEKLGPEATEHYTFLAKNNLALFGQNLFSLNEIKGELLFDAQSRIFIDSPAYSLLLEDSDAFELRKNAGKSEYTYYSRIDNSPLAVLVDLFNVDPKNEYSLANRFEQNWKCLQSQQVGEKISLELEPAQSTAALKKLKISFTRNSLEEVSLEILTNAINSTEISLVKSKEPTSLEKKIPIHLRIPAEASFSKY